ncbi:MAG: hypothetical protein HN341_14940 [Verrucomicrobia bacterium]|nr:hypothetical protein [Verrucomicrobiota bacterium]
MSTLFDLILLTCGWVLIVAGCGFYKRAEIVISSKEKRVSGLCGGHVARRCCTVSLRSGKNRSFVRERRLKQL